MRLIFNIVDVLGFLLTALGTYLTIRNGSDCNIIRNELAVGIGILLIVFSVFGFHYFRKYEIAKSVILGREELIKAHYKAFQFSNELNRNKPPHITKCITEFSTICQHIRSGLRRFHKVEVSTCILYINKDEKNTIYAKTLSRDTDTFERREQSASISDIHVSIFNNTDFRHIFDSIKKKPIEQVHYFNNAIPLSVNYRNTHIHREWQYKYYCWYGLIPRLFAWKLPYRSTIVVPIIPRNSQKVETIEGFLCVDSPNMFVFSKKYDLPVIKELASSIYPALRTFNSKREKIMKNGKQ